MKIGILGAGGIAVQMAKTVAGMKDVENYAVAARSLERAQAFAQKHGISRAYGSYEEMLADPQVDLVYIATPHSHHYLHAKMCLEAGKNVLCEKAFTVNADQEKPKRHAYKYYTDIVIQKGESLWDIANEHMTEEYDSPKTYIKEVKSINSLTDVDKIYAGQRIVIPYYSTELK